MTTTIAIHGNAVSYPEPPGPDAFEQVQRVPWSDLVGLRTGACATYRGRARRFAWFHYALMTPGMLAGTATKLSRLQVLLTTRGAATLESVHVWNNARQRLFAADGLGRAGDSLHSFGPAGLRAESDLGVSLGVFFRETAEVDFRGLVADFEPTVAPPPPLAVVFDGTATMRTTNANAGGPFSKAVQLPFMVRGSSPRQVELSGFPPISVTYPVPAPVNMNTTTVTWKRGGAGTFDPATGRLDMNITLMLAHSVGPPLAGPSDLELMLTTGSVTSPNGILHETGAPRDLASGRIRVVGAGRFVGGFLGADDGSVVLDGTLSPIP